MSRCPYCEYGELIDTPGGMWCPVCKKFVATILVYDEEKEENDKADTVKDTDSPADQ
jgi:hypothetical protein